MGQIGSLVSFAPNTIIRSADHNSNNNTIKTTYNTHDAATSGMHGITGSFVGTTDTQTLTNKTLTDPIINSTLFTLDQSNSRIYSGATSTTTIDGVNYQFQLTSLSAGTSTMALISTATGTTGVVQASYHNSASPANGDDIHVVKIYGNDSAGNVTEYVRLLSEIKVATDGSEQGDFGIQILGGGSITTSAAFFYDQVQVRPESFVVGTTTNVGPQGYIHGLYVKSSDSDRRTVLFESTDSTANPLHVQMYKNSSSPAASDQLAILNFCGNDSGGNFTTYADIRGYIVDSTDGSEDGEVLIRSLVAGTGVTHLTIGQGITAITSTLEVTGNTNFITSTDTTGDAFTITASSLTTGSALRVYSNSTSTSSRNLVEIINDSASADAAVCLYIKNDGDDSALIVTGSSVFPDSTAKITNNGSGYALEIDTTAGSANNNVGIYIASSNSGAGDAWGLFFQNIGTDYAFGFGAALDGTALGAYRGRIIITDNGTPCCIPVYEL